VPTYQTAIVREVLAERSGLQRVRVEMSDGSDARAYALTRLVGTVDVDDEVICNTTAVDRGLGTGGWHVVHWNLARRELRLPGPEHIMKLRYTSLQSDAGTSELAHPEAADAALDGIPVVACSVHSQVAMVALGFAAAAPRRRLAYVMTDGAALPLALSDLVAELVERELLAATVTSGHAFGGDLEAVSLPSALGLARHVADADAVVVGMGPGVVGTGTDFGTTAVEVASVMDVAERRGGRPVLCVRASEGDPRSRHRGVSHHVRSILELTHVVPLVAAHPPEVLGLAGVSPIELDHPPDASVLLHRAGIRVTTMGRAHDEDPLFFAAATAAGALAGQLCSQRLPDDPGTR
jgi:hypothetical protein